MKLFFVTILCSLSLSSFANNEEKVKKSIECFNDVTSIIGIGLSQAYHGAKPNSTEEKKAKARLDKFNETISGYFALPTACAENTETEIEKNECIAETFKSETFRLAKKYKALEAYRLSPNCK